MTILPPSNAPLSQLPRPSLRESTRPRAGYQLLGIALSVAVLTSLASHVAIYWLHLDTRGTTLMKFGPSDAKMPILATGSSLTFYGLSFDSIAEAVAHPVIGWTIPAASPCELEQLQSTVPVSKANSFILGISIFDLNEFALSDYRADVTPFSRSVADLLQSHSDWAFVKRVAAQYPLHYARWLYPTAGRSLGIMAGLREKFGNLARSHTSNEEAALALDIRSRKRITESIQDWSPGRTLRNLSLVRAQCQGKQDFSGPKFLALKRMLQQPADLGPVVVVVMPVSPPYEQEFVDRRVAARFEQALAEAQANVPSAHWVRLDQLPQLKSNALYWDLVHLNESGQAIATTSLLEHLRSLNRK